MGKLFRKIVLFILFSAVIYVIGIIVWGDFVPERLHKNLNYKIGSIGQMQLRLNEFDTINQLDLLFVGSSTTYRGFDTRIFRKYGIKAFNLGSSAQTPAQTKYLLKKYIDSIDVKLVVIDAIPLMFTIDGVESSLDLISNDDYNNQMVEMAFEVNNLKVYNTLIYKWYYDEICNREKEKISRTRNGDTYRHGGFVEHKLDFYKHKNYNSQKWKYEEKQFKIFREIIQLLHDKQINFIIIQSPITGSLYNSYTNNEIFDEFMHQQADYYNFNYIINLDDSLHFIDAHHLNQLGVEKYNNFFANRFLADSLNLN